MYCNTFIDNILTAVTNSGEFKKVLWGLELPTDINNAYVTKTLPACFLWGGQSVITVDSELNMLNEKQTMNAYLILFDISATKGNQSDGIKELNRLEVVFINILRNALNDNSLNLTGDMIIDRDTTFVKVGTPWNYQPPYYASRIEFTLENIGGSI